MTKSNPKTVRKCAAPRKSKLVVVKASGQEIALMVAYNGKIFNNDNSGKFGAKS